MANEKFILYRDDKIFAALSQEGYERDLNHKYIIYANKPPDTFLSQAAEIITSYYFNDLIKQPIKKWKKDQKLYIIHWPHFNTGETISSSNINYLIIVNELRTFGTFDCNKFNLFPLDCTWLDNSLDISQNFHLFDDGNKDALLIHDGIPQQQYGDHYPIFPKLDREGHIFTTFQPALLKRIINQRELLITNSDKSLFSDWVLDLRNLINDSISLLDITLNQIYNKAQYSPGVNWHFDKEKLGEKYSRRLKDKLKWVSQISGKPLNIAGEFKKLDKLRKIRNHLNHFDPPTLVITLEEATTWLNDILYIGQILIKIRECLGVPVSSLLIELVCQKEAVFNPEKAFSKRLPIVNTGYISSIWADIDSDE